MGTPKRCAEPTTTSAPHSPGGVSSTSASRSVATATSVPCACRVATSSRSSRITPVVPGYCSNTPNTPSVDMFGSGGPTTTSIPSGSARVRTTSMVCGWQPASTKNVSPPLAFTRRSMVIASAAAVASSSSDTLARSMAVRSLTMVWKFRSASSRPCEISGWYGV